MAYENLKSAIKQAIKQNGNQEITGAILQSTLLSIVDGLDNPIRFLGIVSPDTSSTGFPVKPFLNYVLADKQGIYKNFNNIVVNSNYTIFYRTANSEKWIKSEINIPYSLCTIEVIKNLYAFHDIIANTDAGHIQKYFSFSYNESSLGYLNSDGTISENYSCAVSDYIAVPSNFPLIMPRIFKAVIVGLEYDSNKHIIGPIKYADVDEACQIITSENAAFIRVNYPRFIKEIDAFAFFSIYAGYLHRANSVNNKDIAAARLNFQSPDSIGFQSLISKFYISDKGCAIFDGVVRKGYDTIDVSNYIPVIPGKKLCYFTHVSRLSKVGCFYDKNLTYLRDFQVKNASVNSILYDIVPDNAAYIRINITKGCTFAYDSTYMHSPNRLISGIESIFVQRNPVNLLEGCNITPDYVVVSNGQLYNLKGSAMTDYIPVKPSTNYIIYPSEQYTVAWYDSDKKFLSVEAVEISSTLISEIKVKSDKAAAFAIVNINSKNSSGYYMYEEYKTKIRIPELTQNSYWYGKIIAWFGTSIPAGYPHTDNQSKYSYANKTAENLGAEIRNYCVPNGVIRRYKHDGSALQSGRELLSFTNLKSAINYKNTILDKIGTLEEASLYVLDYGVNDLDEDNYDEQQQTDYSSMSLNTFVGSYNFVISKIYSANPKARIMIATHFSDDGAQVGRHYGKDAWKKLNDMITGIARHWGIPVIKFNEETGWVFDPATNIDNIRLYCPSDLIHPANDQTLDSIEILTSIATKYIKDYR